YPFKPDVAVSIDDVFDKKLHAIDALESQVYEGGALGTQETLRQRMAHDPVARKEILARNWKRRQGGIADRYRETLLRWYGVEKGQKVKYAEAFEICEYGRQPSQGELKELFPFTKQAE
ncbi:MAG: PIG-L family deacetylase, partial [Planctomycetota bacterium]|nr:PIG-L family deacetylase [Planctomycetota bacterium]MEE2989418.1 PIG-L family deacetylase [Planctomycetota bacterium]